VSCAGDGGPDQILKGRGIRRSGKYFLFKINFFLFFKLFYFTIVD